MRTLMIGLALLGLALMAWGWQIDHGPGSADVRVGAVVPYIIGLALLGADALVLIGWAIWRA